MVIDKEQKNLLKNISKTEITEIYDFFGHKEHKMIKEKPVSFNNTLNNCKIIPMAKTSFDKKKNINFKVVEVNFDEISGGKSKPIYVKDSMVENMIGHRLIEDTNASNKDTNDLFLNPKVSENSVIGSMPLDSVDLLIKEFEDLNSSINKKMDNLRKAKEEVENSNGLIENLNFEYLKAIDELRKVEEIDKDLDSKLISVINTQKSVLNDRFVEMDKYEKNISKEQEENNRRISEFKSNIDNTKKQIEVINEKILKKEELLNFFKKNNYIGKEINDEENQSIKMVA